MTKKWLTWSSLSILGALPILPVVACANANDNPVPATGNQNKSVSKEVLGLEGTITDAKMIIDKAWIWNHLKQLIDNSAEIKTMESLGDSINLKVSENDKTKGILTFFTTKTVQEINNKDEEISTIVVDKKYQVEINNFVEETDDFEKAFENVKNYINDNKYKIMGQLAAQIEVREIPVIDKKLNLNFETKINNLNYIDSNNLPNVHLGINNEKGEKEIEIVLTRGAEKRKFNYTITGLTTTKQQEFESKIKIDDYLDLSQNKYAFGLLSDFLNVEKIEQTFVRKEADGTTKSEFLKQDLPTGYSLKFSNPKSVISKEYGFVVIANVQIVENSSQQATSFRQIIIKELGMGADYENETLLENLADFFPKRYSVLERNLSRTKASSVKTTEDFNRLLHSPDSDGNVPNYKEGIFNELVDVELLDLVEGGADDAEGYLKVKLAFKWRSSSSSSNEKIIKTVRIYGFMLDADEEKND